eukprot:gnl/TRDRNA2_/TRDRNA2_177240_c0_seq2.p1 gnl/TRDRNA2_/TRDRNA2_177240_c0~~gnl/TRDRNA2_/TRDRNA2_177240_c0_seq2.p1  ORF type:complete len:256 (+),score=36.27 gnl/TRDRNA2_/TRDRNA2_177240_c0_seq2:513-1280(+)
MDVHSICSSLPANTARALQEWEQNSSSRLMRLLGSTDQSSDEIAADDAQQKQALEREKRRLDNNFEELEAKCRRVSSNISIIDERREEVRRNEQRRREEELRQEKRQEEERQERKRQEENRREEKHQEDMLHGLGSTIWASCSYNCLNDFDCKAVIVALGFTGYIFMYADGTTAWSGIPKALDNKLRGRQQPLPHPDVLALSPDNHQHYFVQFADGRYQWHAPGLGNTLAYRKAWQTCCCTPIDTVGSKESALVP